MSEKPKVGVLLVNLGTPDSFRISDIRSYLKEFLFDPRVLSLPLLLRYFLVHYVIAPFRAKTSAKAYKAIWTKQGSPLLFYSSAIKDLLQKSLGDLFIVELGMRYKKPSIELALDQLFKKPLKKLIVIPLFPQYASATTGSIFEKIFKLLQNKPTIPSLSFIHSFHDHPLFINAFATQIESYTIASYDHLLLSFHGLPKKQLIASNPFGTCRGSSICCQKMHAKNTHCYSAQCHKTAQLIAGSLNLEDEKYSICFQSRLGRSEWLKPYTLETIKSLAKQGIKKLLVACPSFICDCLETLYEIQVEYEHCFKEHGGHTLTLVKSLNTHDLWIKTLVDIVEKENSTLCLQPSLEKAFADTLSL